MEMKVEEHNLKEEIKEIVSKSLKSGIENKGCSVYRVIREEQYSPRGKAIILDNGFYEKIIYDCNLCKACEVNSPLSLKLCEAFQKARRVLVLQNKETPENKRMMENLKATGNIYGIKEWLLMVLNNLNFWGKSHQDPS